MVCIPWKWNNFTNVRYEYDARRYDAKDNQHQIQKYISFRQSKSRRKIYNVKHNNSTTYNDTNNN